MQGQVFILLTLIAIGLADEQCCKNYNDTFVVSSEFENWHQALINCEAAGMKLATIKSKADEENFEKFLLENKHTGGYWLGATNLGTKGYYWATTGEPTVYTNWGVGNPSNSNNNEHCIQFGGTNFSDPTTPPGYFAWNDLNCDSLLNYICEKAPCCEDASAAENACWCSSDE